MANSGAVSNTVGSHYFETTVYGNFYPSTKLALGSYAIAGRQCHTMESEKVTNFSRYGVGDVVVYWEITNECDVQGTSAADCFTQIQQFSDYVRSRGMKFVFMTALARDKAGDAADLLTRIQATNQLVRNAGSSIYDAICDCGADSRFNSRGNETTTGCSDTTYYSTDKIHITPAAGSIIITMLNSTLSAVL